MNLEKNLIYQIIIVSAIVLSILSILIVWQMFFIWPLFLIGGLILLIIIRKNKNIDDERSLKISEKASEKTIIVFIFGSFLLLFISGFITLLFRDLMFSDEFPRVIFECIGSMFQSAFILALIYLVFYVYYRYNYGG